MTARKTPARKRTGVPRATSRLAPDTLRVRMYRVGFGDCFLLSLPLARARASGETHAHLLFDCGVHVQGDVGTIGRAVQNVERETGGRLAVLVATHAHQDHISGYARYADTFARFRIGEVWLPWTWDPRDRTAARLQKKQAALVERLHLHLDALGARADAAAAAAVANLCGNQAAIADLRGAFGTDARVRYLEAGDTLARGDDLPVPGLSVRVLGPPRSEEFLAQMDPPSGQRYLRASGGVVVPQDAILPFPEVWRVSREALASDRLRQLLLGDEGERELARAVAAPLAELAFALDQARNNESVVTLLRFRGHVLLFAGDAQYGNWRWWLERDDAQTILEDVEFLKVAHHGSQNATPTSALERMREGRFSAMVSTQSTPWPSIPRVPLMQRLDARTQRRVVRSDWVDVDGAPTPLRGAAPKRPSRLPAGFTEGAFWIDWQLAL